MCTTAGTIPCNFCIRSSKFGKLTHTSPYLRNGSRHTPQPCNCVSTCSKRARMKLCPSLTFVFHLGMSCFLGLGYGVTDPQRPPNPPSSKCASPGLTSYSGAPSSFMIRAFARTSHEIPPNQM